MSASFYDLLKFAKTGVAAPSMTAYDKLKALALCGGGFPVSTISGVPPISFKSDGSALTAWSITGDMVQTGTPTPSAPITPQECGDKTANLFDEKTVTFGRWYSSNGNYSNERYGAVSTPIDVSGISSLTAKWHGTAPYSWSIILYDANGDFIEMKHSQNPVNTKWSVANASTIIFQVASATTTTITPEVLSSFKIMLNSGSTALDYEPFGVKLPITLGTTQNVYLSEPIRKIGDYADMASATGTVGTATRRVKTLVLTGEENYTDYSFSGTLGVYVSNVLDTNYTRVMGICSHYPVSTIATVNTLWIGANDKRLYFVGIRDVLGVETAAEVKAWVAQQYANGTPVTVWYVLATPTEESFDAPTLTPAKGANTLSIGTTLPPSGVSITGHIQAAT